MANKQVVEERVYSAYPSVLLSGQELKAGRQGGREYVLSGLPSKQGLLSLLSYMAQDHLSRSGTIHSGLDLAMSNSSQSRKMTTGRSDDSGFYINLAQSRVNGKRDSELKTCLWTSTYCMFSISDRWGRA